MQTETTAGMTPRTAIEVANREKPTAFGDCPGCGERDRDGFDVETGVGLCEVCATADDVEARTDGNGGMNYHVVCRDCPYESIEETEEWAQARVTAHDWETGHDVEYSPINGGAV